jgi:2-(1,2-epoxy-1,2-dihydrophenyl)acetyl-CoA isomerase
MTNNTTVTEDIVKFELDEGVGVVTLNRPERLNAINWEMAVQLINLFRDLRLNDEVRSIVITGAGGRAFCAGGDVEWLSGSTDRPIPGLSDLPVPRYQRKTPGGPFAEFIRTLVEVDKPVIAAISGVAVGAGLSIALACDRRFADKKSRFSAIFVKRGLGADIGITWFLPRIVGLSKALKMVETGEMLDAQSATDAGIVDELLEDGEAYGAALGYAKDLARGASVAIDINRRLVYKSLTSTLEEMLDYDAIAATLTAMTVDAKEGTTSFMEKREAQFKGF